MWVFCALCYFICGESGLKSLTAMWLKLLMISTVSLTCVYDCSCVVYIICGASVVDIIILWLHNIVSIILWSCLCYVVFVSLNCSSTIYNANDMITNVYNSIYCAICLLWSLLLDYRWLPHLRRRKLLQRRLTKDWKWTMTCLGPFNTLRDTKILSWREL